MAKLVADELVVEDDKDGLRITEKYRVSTTEISGATPQAQMQSALSATNVPALGAVSALDATVKCVARRVMNTSATVIDVICQFEVPRDDKDNSLLDTTGVVRFRSALIEEETGLDKDGNLMSGFYHGGVPDFLGGFGGAGVFGTPGLPLTTFHRAEIMRPQWGFELTKRFTGPTAISTPTNQALAYIGRVNVSSWNGLIVFPPRSCLCTDIGVEQRTENEIYATYGFEYRPKLWDFTAYFKAFGRLPSNLDDPPGNGVSVFQIYDTVDFNALGVHI